MFWNGDSDPGLALYPPFLLLKVPFNRLGYCIRARENLSLPVPDRGMAADALQLSNDIFRLNPRSKSQRDQATDGLGLRGDAASRLSYLIKDLKNPSLPIFVHRHIEISAAGADLSGRTVYHILASPWLP